MKNVWNHYTGKGIKIAVLDDSFDPDHPEYKRADGSNVILDESRYYYVSGDEVRYQEFSENPDCLIGDWVFDDNSYSWDTHGVATSTTALAPMNNGGIVGIAPEADLLALKIDMRFASISAAMTYAVDQGADIINMSLGAYSERFIDGFGIEHYYSSAVSGYLEDACNYAYDHGVIVVVAAGNEATSHKSYPACNSHVIAAGALGENEANQLAPFTNYVDPNQTGEVNVDILAPGFVYAAVRKGDHYNPKHTYAKIQGTSFSCPIVAGAAALWKEQNPSGNPDEFLEKLQLSATDIGKYYNEKVPVKNWSNIKFDESVSHIECGRLNVPQLLDIAPYLNVKEASLELANETSTQLHVSSSALVNYSSSDASIVTVDQNGLVQAIGVGETNIVVSSSIGGNLISKEVLVKVYNYVSIDDLSLTTTDLNLSINEDFDVEPLVNVLPNEGTRLFNFASDNHDVLSIDSKTGHLHTLTPGVAHISITPKHGSGSATLTIDVIDYPVTSVAYRANGEKISGFAPDGASVEINPENLNSTFHIQESNSYTFTIKGFDSLRIRNIKLRIANDASIGEGIISLTNNNQPIDLCLDISNHTNLRYNYDYYEILNRSFTVNGDVVLTITSLSDTLYFSTIEVTYFEPSDKIVNGLNVSFNHETAYVDDVLTSKDFEVYATFVGPYENRLLNPVDYEISGYDSSVIGTTNATITYIGNLDTSSSNISTAVEVNVKEDSVVGAVVACKKDRYNVGDTIYKNDIYVADKYESGKEIETDDFDFGEILVTYEMSTICGEFPPYEFNVTYKGESYLLSVGVGRYNPGPSYDFDFLFDITAEELSSSGVSSTQQDYNINVEGINLDISNGYVKDNLISFGKESGEIKTLTPLNYPIFKVYPVRANGSRVDAEVYLSEDGLNYINQEDANFVMNTYLFFKISYSTSSDTDSKLTRIVVERFDNLDIYKVTDYVMMFDTEGQCNSLVNLALARLNCLNDNAKEIFWNETEYTIKSGRERLIAWCHHIGVDLIYENNEFELVPFSSRPLLNGYEENSNNALVITVIMTSLASISTLGLILIKKRRKSSKI